MITIDRDSVPDVLLKAWSGYQQGLQAGQQVKDQRLAQQAKEYTDNLWQAYQAQRQADQDAFNQRQTALQAKQGLFQQVKDSDPEGAAALFQDILNDQQALSQFRLTGPEFLSQGFQRVPAGQNPHLDKAAAAWRQIAQSGAVPAELAPHFDTSPGSVGLGGTPSPLGSAMNAPAPTPPLTAPPAKPGPAAAPPVSNPNAGGSAAPFPGAPAGTQVPGSPAAPPSATPPKGAARPVPAALNNPVGQALAAAAPSAELTAPALPPVAPSPAPSPAPSLTDASAGALPANPAGSTPAPAANPAPNAAAAPTVSFGGRTYRLPAGTSGEWDALRQSIHETKQRASSDPDAWNALDQLERGLANPAAARLNPQQVTDRLNQIQGKLEMVPKGAPEKAQAEFQKNAPRVTEIAALLRKAGRDDEAKWVDSVLGTVADNNPYTQDGLKALRGVNQEFLRIMAAYPDLKQTKFDQAEQDKQVKSLETRFQKDKEALTAGKFQRPEDFLAAAQRLQGIQQHPLLKDRTEEFALPADLDPTPQQVTRQVPSVTSGPLPLPGGGAVLGAVPGEPTTQTALETPEEAKARVLLNASQRLQGAAAKQYQKAALGQYFGLLRSGQFWKLDDAARGSVISGLNEVLKQVDPNLAQIPADVKEQLSQKDRAHYQYLNAALSERKAHDRAQELQRERAVNIASSRANLEERKYADEAMLGLKGVPAALKTELWGLVRDEGAARKAYFDALKQNLGMQKAGKLPTGEDWTLFKPKQAAADLQAGHFAATVPDENTGRPVPNPTHGRITALLGLYNDWQEARNNRLEMQKTLPQAPQVTPPGSRPAGRAAASGPVWATPATSGYSRQEYAQQLRVRGIPEADVRAMTAQKYGAQ